MKYSLKLEETAMFFFSIILFSQLHFAWWWYLALFLAPDLSMLGYLINTRVGAYSYNFFHHKGVAIVVGLAGFISATKSICSQELFYSDTPPSIAFSVTD